MAHDYPIPVGPDEDGVATAALDPTPTRAARSC